MKTRRVEFLVIGAGLQGACIALELALRGKPVTLIDQDPWPINRASLRNEGKIHLGLIYAADTSMQTAKLQLRAALHFRRLLARWLGTRLQRIGVSTPFTYLVARDSLLDADALARHYEALGQNCDDQMRMQPELDYLGAKPGRLTTPAPRGHVERFFDGPRIADAFLTEERAIDTDDLAIAIREAIDRNDRISFVGNTRIDEIIRSTAETRVGGLWTDSGERCEIVAEHVVNATWEQRLRLDQMAGLALPEGWLHRLKYRAIVQLPDRLREQPSATMVLGRYGDVVVRANGSAYLSWYPACLKGWSHALSPPDDWDAPCRGMAEPEMAAAIGAEIVREVSVWYPSMAASRLLTVDAGAIVAYGQSDVDDPGSGLHGRTQVCVSGDQAYLSVDPGKLTTAPLFALQAVDRLLGLHSGLSHDER